MPAAPDRNDAAGRQQVVATYCDLARRGMNTGSSGNVSLRSRHGMLITPSGCSADTLDANAVVAMSLSGDVSHAVSGDVFHAVSGDASHAVSGDASHAVSGDASHAVSGDASHAVSGDMSHAVSHRGTPSSEWAMHAAIYAACAEAQCIVHTHADSCTALACLGQALPAFHYMVVRFGGDDVRCAPYVTFGTPALAHVAVHALQDRSACLLANHGMIVHGRDAAQALADAVLLETLCRQYLLARAAGPVRLLTPAEMRDARQRFRTYGGPAAGKTAATV